MPDKIRIKPRAIG